MTSHCPDCHTVVPVRRAATARLAQSSAHLIALRLVTVIDLEADRA
jgi:hypothetical protein